VSTPPFNSPVSDFGHLDGTVGVGRGRGQRAVRGDRGLARRREQGVLLLVDDEDLRGLFAGPALSFAPS
jgi:hypothetical protein